jgi:hypothetical protein
MENRWGTRAVVDAQAEFRSADGDQSLARVINASLSGALIRTNRRLPLLSHVAIRLEHGDGAWLHACVVRHDAQGLGVEWQNPGLRAVAELLARRRQSPEQGISLHRAEGRASAPTRPVVVSVIRNQSRNVQPSASSSRPRDSCTP